MAEVETPVAQANRDVMAQALGLRQSPAPVAQTPTVTTETPVVTPQAPAVAEAPKVAPAVAETAPTVAATAPAAEGSWLDKITAPAPVATDTGSLWDDKAKVAFKETFGHEDPVKFKDAYTQQVQELELIKPELEPLRGLKKFVDELSPAMAEALSLYREGKDPIGYLTSLPKALVSDRPVKDVPDLELVDHYFKGKITPENKAAIADPDTDPAIKEAIKDKIKVYADPARDLYLRDQEAPKKAAQERAAKAVEAQKAYDQSITTNVVNARKSFVAPLIDQGTIDQFKSGDIVRKFLYQEDGVTIRPDLLTDIVWAMNRKSVEERLTRGIVATAKSEGAQEATSRLPNGPFGNGRVVTQSTEQAPDLARDIIKRATGVKA